MLKTTVTFKLTQDHLNLINRLYIDHNDSGYDGAAAADMKRPYGNSGACYYDVPMILKMTPNEEGEFTEEQIKIATMIHQEVAVALQICCYTLTFEVGTYQRDGEYDTHRWKKIS